MGKKKRSDVSYETTNLAKMVEDLNKFRKLAERRDVVPIKPDMATFEEVIKALPRKEREICEKYWGLIPGTNPHKRGKPKGKALGAHEMVLVSKLGDVIIKLIGVDYIHIYDVEARELFQKIREKINMEGFEGSENEAIKYILIYFIFIADGPNSVCENGSWMLTEKEEEDVSFDFYNFLEIIWEDMLNKLPDNSIHLKVLISVVEMFDCKYVETMKAYVGLPVHRDYVNVELQVPITFKEIRLFKEKLFQRGAWSVTDTLIYQGIDLKKFFSKIGKLRKNRWQDLDSFKSANSREIKTTKGKVTLPTYEIGGLSFTDDLEIMFLSTVGLPV